MPNAKGPNNQQTHFGHQCDGWREQGPQKIDAIVHRQIVLVGLTKPSTFPSLLGERFDHSNARDGVGQDVGELRPHAINFLKAQSQTIPYHMNEPINKRQGQQGHHGQIRVDGEKNDGGHHDHQKIGRKIQKMKRQEHTYAIRLTTNAGHQVTRASTTKILKRELHQMVVGTGAQIGPNALRHQRQNISFEPAQGPSQKSRCQQAQQIG